MALRHDATLGIWSDYCLCITHADIYFDMYSCEDNQSAGWIPTNQNGDVYSKQPH
jgi:hypothetical protein